MRRCGPRPHHVRRPEADAESTYSSRSAIVYANIIEGRGRNELRITQASTRPVFNTPSNLYIFNPHRSMFQVHRQDWMQSCKCAVCPTETTNNSSVVYVMSAAVTKDFFAAAAVLCVYSKPFS